MRKERLQDQGSGGLPDPTCGASEPDQNQEPKTGVSVPAGLPSAGSWPDEGDTPKTGIAVPVRSEAE